ncbi:hypothetical protein [Streptomyces sp. 35G-GA-8]|uniref:hypothetical protein n=1 Tax=Streptomyces sp. 35G-GA-8 TaxID=2939434 RepID=UPI00201ECAAD|nr:hypothetical protein [Streptomyces sp. 35G-GA-8]MCL7382589.1 hypothetical protein [Streptomyces sp. 35G-GA-8]
MRLFPSPPAAGSDPSQGALTTKELIVVVVAIVVAATLAALGMPLFGAIEFISGALYVAGRSVRAMRTAPPLTGTA